MYIVPSYPHEATVKEVKFTMEKFLFPLDKNNVNKKKYKPQNACWRLLNDFEAVKTQLQINISLN